MCVKKFRKEWFRHRSFCVKSRTPRQASSAEIEERVAPRRDECGLPGVEGEKVRGWGSVNVAVVH